MNNELELAHTELRETEAKRNAAYWIFTRCSNGKPVPRELTRKVYELREHITTLITITKQGE